MCGIAGFFNKTEEVDEAPVNEMLSLIRHRGPNDDGTESFGMFDKKFSHNVVAGFVRLSIRDLSMRGHQPMFNQAGNLLIVFNGEIYNAEAIREELTAEGVGFNGTSDTEVILKYYEKNGIDETLKRLNGMFAIALFDKTRDVIYLIRDRVGEKPLYYYQKESLFMFASEYKAFYAHPEFIPELNNDVIDEFCIFRYVSDHETLLKNVYSVRPGSYMTITGTDNMETQYYNIPAYGVKRTLATEEEFEEAVHNSVISRMVSDVEVGVQLSGGVDSSTVMYIANQRNGSMKSFSVVFDNPDFSEEKYIDMAMKKTGGESFKYKMHKTDFLSALYNTTWNFEAPVNHHGSVQLYFLCRSVRDRVNVILTGEGADELLGGYGWYPVSMFYKSGSVIWRLRALLHKIKHTDHMYWEDRRDLSDEEKFLLADSQTAPCLIDCLRPGLDYKKVIRKRKRIYDSCQGAGLEKKLNYEMKTFMVDLLMRQDKVSMASSIECRVPFVDHELIEFVRKNIGPEDLVKRQSFGRNRQNTKLILKRLAERYFGREFSYRKKMGLPSPLEEYFYEPDFVSFMYHVILPNVQKRGIFNYEYVKECYEARSNLSNVVWRALTFEVWAMMYIDDGGKGVLSHAEY